MSYNVTNAQLREFGNKYKWFFEDDAEEIDENRLIKIGDAVKLVVSPNDANLHAEIERLNKIIEELKQPKHEEDDDVDDDGEIEVIHTNVFQPQPKKVKKTQDMNNIISAFDTALLKMKS
jgi:hypothetical protein